MTDASQTCPVREHLHQAVEELAQAHEATVERLLGERTAGHLRQAARHALQAGLAAIDAADQRARARTSCGETERAGPTCSG
jgi:hypothetical protein